MVSLGFIQFVKKLLFDLPYLNSVASHIHIAWAAQPKKTLKEKTLWLKLEQIKKLLRNREDICK